MQASAPPPAITRSLEDYLECIYRIQARESVARVGDIAGDLGVSPASVTPAMRRLSGMGLLRYSKRRYVELTPEGEAAARKTLVRHRLLTRFLQEILGMEPGAAGRDACALEHDLSDEALRGLADLFETTAACPVFPDLVRGRPDAGGRNMDVPRGCPLLASADEPASPGMEALSELPPGSRGVVARLEGDADCRSGLIDLGLIQGAEVTLRRPGGGVLPCIVGLDGHDLEIDEPLAACVMVLPLPVPGDGSA